MYIRCFIPLAQDARGYEFKGRAPAGRAVVEGRGGSGKFTCRVQDLKPLVKYRVYIIYARGSGFGNLDMGLLDVDERGRGEFRRDLDDENWPNVAAVVVVADGADGHISPLCGYRDSAVPWRQGFIVRPPKEKDPVAEEPTPEPLPTPEPIVEEPAAPEPLAQEPEPAETETKDGETKDGEQAILDEIYANSAPWEPLNLPLTALDLKWVRCKYNKFLDELKLPLTMSDPFLQNSWADYGHFVVGIGDGKHVIGIPGEFSPVNAAVASALGLIFHGQNVDPQHGDEGYWVIKSGVFA